jgi:hypothetical protein
MAPIAEAADGPTYENRASGGFRAKKQARKKPAGALFRGALRGGGFVRLQRTVLSER